MNSREANLLITKASLIDPFMTPDPDRAEAWAELLPEVSLEVGFEALRVHYRSENSRITPAIILAFAGVRDEVESQYEDITEAVVAADRARALQEAGVTEAEYLEHAHDIEWLREKFPPVVTALPATVDEDGEPE